MSIIPPNVRIKRDSKSAIKLLLYGAPGVGKSYFAYQFPDPLILSTDGNYIYSDLPALSINQWKASMGTGGAINADEASHSFVNVVNELIRTNGGEYKTIVVDLLEGVYAFCRQEKLKELKVTYEGDLDHGKGWFVVSEEFIDIITKLYSLPLNVILISHEDKSIKKDRIGREYVYYSPQIRDSIIDRISGTGYSLRAYQVAGGVNAKGEIIKEKRMLSLGPKSSEFGVLRFVNPDGTPREFDDIILDYNEFSKLFTPSTIAATAERVEKIKEITTPPAKKAREEKAILKEKQMTIDETNLQPEFETKEEIKSVEEKTNISTEGDITITKKMSLREKLDQLKNKINADNSAKGE